MMEASDRPDSTKDDVVDPEEQTISSDDHHSTSDNIESKSPRYKKELILVLLMLTIVLIAAVIVGLSIDKKDDEDQRNVPMSISKVALNDGNEFLTEDSYQSKALQWLENNEFVEEYSDEKMVQRYALACLYFATFGVPNKYTDDEMLDDGQEVPGWAFSDKWLTDTNECLWHGITCDQEDGFDNPEDFSPVTEISLFENRMTGVLPPEISLLGPSLSLLELGMNGFLMGGIDFDDSRTVISNLDEMQPHNEWLGKLTMLRQLYIPFCKFYSNTGIPTELAKLTLLEEYDSAYNVFFGPLQGETFEHLNELVWLDISGGFYQSPIPSQILHLPMLEDFFIDDSYITDDVSYLTSLKHIYQHTADQNQKISGSLPEADVMSENIMVLSFSYCNLTGSIPSSYGEIENMQRLYLNDNMLSGEIPSELGKLSVLETLELQGNYIRGTMPEEICENVILDEGGALDDGTITSLIADCDTGEVECSLETCCTACGTKHYD